MSFNQRGGLVSTVALWVTAPQPRQGRANFTSEHLAQGTGARLVFFLVGLMVT
jgi:hypothetical protein